MKKVALQIQKKWIKRTDLGREEGFVIQLILNPGHQVVNVLGSRALNGLLNVGPICPMILVSKGKEMGEAAETDPVIPHCPNTLTLVLRT